MHVLCVRTSSHDLARVGASGPPGAVASQVAAALRAAGDSVDEVVLTGPLVPDAWSAGVQRLSEDLEHRGGGADAVHALDVVAAAAALSARRLTGARVVVRAALGPLPADGPLRVLWPLVLRAADAVVAPTAADARAAIGLGAAAGAVVRCVDGALVAAVECAATAPMVDEIRSEDYLLGLSGAPADERVQRELLRAARAVGERLVIASPSEHDRDARTALRQLAEQHGMADRVELVGRVEGQALFDLVDRSQAVLATRTETSCGLAPLVAMHRARPVVALAGAMSDEVVVDGVTGRVVDPAVPYAVASAVEDLARGRFRRLAWAVAGRDRVESCYAPEQVTRELARAHEVAAA